MLLRCAQLNIVFRTRHRKLPTLTAAFPRFFRTRKSSRPEKQEQAGSKKELNDQETKLETEETWSEENESEEDTRTSKEEPELNCPFFTKELLEKAADIQTKYGGNEYWSSYSMFRWRMGAPIWLAFAILPTPFFSPEVIVAAAVLQWLPVWRPVDYIAIRYLSETYPYLLRFTDNIPPFSTNLWFKPVARARTRWGMAYDLARHGRHLWALPLTSFALTSTINLELILQTYGLDYMYMTKALAAAVLSHYVLKFFIPWHIYYTSKEMPRLHEKIEFASKAQEINERLKAYSQKEQTKLADISDYPAILRIAIPVGAVFNLKTDEERLNPVADRLVELGALYSERMVTRDNALIVPCTKVLEKDTLAMLEDDVSGIVEEKVKIRVIPKVVHKSQKSQEKWF